jgi:hypothetical protein
MSQNLKHDQLLWSDPNYPFMIDTSATSSDVYRAEAHEELLGTSWILLDILTAVNDVVTFTDINAVAFPARFYRLSEEQ